MLIEEVGLQNNNNAISIDTRIRYITVSAERQARAEAMRVERERLVKAERQDAKEEVARMGVEIRAAAMKAERQASAVKLFSRFRLASDCFWVPFRLVD